MAGERFLSTLILLKKIILSMRYLNEMRTKATAFTRNRKMPFPALICFILGMKKKAVQTELEEFFQIMNGGDSVSRQAFAKSRGNLKPEAIRYLNDAIINKFESEDSDILTYKGYRLISIDGTIVSMPNTPELREYYGYSSNGSEKEYAKGLSVMAYDVLNKLIVQADLYRYDAGEKTVVKTVVERLLASDYSNSIMLFDRGFPSFDLFNMIENAIERKVFFVCRVSTNSLKEVNNVTELERLVEICRRKNTIRLRVVNIVLENGEVEKLVTNLPDEFDVADLKWLYSKRWGIETNFDNLKNKQLLEIFTGETRNVILQDFYACILINNLVRFAERENEEIIQEGDKGKNLKYEYHPNAGKLISDTKEILINLLSTKSRLKELLYSMMLYSKIKRHAVAYQPGRSFPRFVREKTRRKATL